MRQCHRVDERCEGRLRPRSKLKPVRVTEDTDLDATVPQKTQNAEGHCRRSEKGLAPCGFEDWLEDSPSGLEHISVESQHGRQPSRPGRIHPDTHQDAQE
jgi:hypothetical protein